jgi:hypothetical protein
MNCPKLFVALAIAMPFAVNAADPIATIGGIEGTVMVNTGERYVNAKPGQALATGDRIMVLSGAKAELVFDDGCKLPLDANTVAVVPATSTCAGAVAEMQSYGPMYAQAVGSSATDAAPPEESERKCGNGVDEEGVDCKAWWIAGSTLAALYVLYKVFEDDDDGREPVSN